MNKKKFCCFYLSDIHLITMLLPYINERINESTEIVTLMETDISESVKKVINGIQGRKQEGLLKIDWRSKKLSSIKKMNLKNKLILVCGRDEFIDEANKIIDNEKVNCEILNCYEMMQASEKLQEILDKHDKVVNTSGEKYAEEVFEGYIRNNFDKVTV